MKCYLLVPLKGFSCYFIWLQELICTFYPAYVFIVVDNAFRFFMGSISSWSHFLIVNCCEHWHISLVFELHSKKFIASVSSNLTSLQFCLFHWYWIALAITANCSTCLCAVFKEILEECYNCVPIVNI